MKKPLAEFIGTFTLVLFGCGAAVLAGADIGLTGISFAFGLALIGMAYGIGPVSGCHINPAVTLGVVAAGRMEFSEAIPYMIAQVAGAIAGALVLMLIATGKADYSVAENGLGQNGWGAGYLGARPLDWSGALCGGHRACAAVAVHRCTDHRGHSGGCSVPLRPAGWHL